MSNLRLISRIRALLARDDSDPAQVRRRAVALTSVSMLVSKAVAIGTTLVSIPLLVGYLGEERFGLWVTSTSLVLFLSFADLGLGSGLLNRVVESVGKDDQRTATTAISSAFFMLCGVSALLVALSISAFLLVDWAWLLNVRSPEARSEAGQAAVVFLLVTALNVPVGIGQRVRLALQQGHVHALWVGAGQLLGLAAIVVCMAFDATLPWLLGAFGLAPLVARVADIATLLRGRPWLWPRWSYFDRGEARWLLRTGALFLALQILFAVGAYSDNFIIARMLGAEAVAAYAVPYKLFSLVPAFIVPLLTPLWPAYGDALARRDSAWVRHVLWRSVTYATAGSLIMVGGMVLVSDLVIPLWIGDDALVPSLSLAVGLASWAVIYSATIPVTTLLNAGNQLRFQVVAALAMVCVNIPLTIVLIPVLGTPGAIWGTVVALLVQLAPMLWFARRYVSRLARDA